MKRHSQHGIALVVTLIMLSLVTFLAVAFLGVAQRERTSNALTSTQTEAGLAADAGLARAQAEFISEMLRNSNRFSYGLMVSTNYINPAGFFSQPIATPVSVATNVNFDYLAGGASLSSVDRMQNIANLKYDPRVPVYVATNTNGPLEFRFYVDINRNGTNERTGLLPEVTTNNQFFSTNGGLVAATAGPMFAPNGVVSNYMVGDPEWIGILEHPEQPHSSSNRFVARYAYMVLPAGLSLDLNYVHNQAKRPTGTGRPELREAFMRNQGLGSWEINLAGFLADLNIDAWLNGYAYSTNSQQSSGFAFEHAKDLLLYRYLTNYNQLDSIFNMYGGSGTAVLSNQNVDLFSDGEANNGNLVRNAQDFSTNIWRRHMNSEIGLINTPWPGATNPMAFYDIQELFATNGRPKFGAYRPYADPTPLFGYNANQDFHDTFKSVMTNRANGQMNLGTYGRYTFHRLLAQMGVDSAPATPGQKINLNFNNIPPNRVTDFIPWTPLTFFTNAAQRMIPYYLNTNTYLWTNYVTGTTTNLLSITNIPIYPVSYYTLELHRILQLAANIYDAMSPHQTVLIDPSTGSPIATVPNPPSVFRPIFQKTVSPAYTNISIVDWVYVGNVPVYGGPVLNAVHVTQASTNTFFTTNVWATMDDVATSALIPAGRLQNVNISGTFDGISYSGQTDVSIKGIPLVVGAKKGLPNFNEFASLTTVLMSRRLELTRNPATSTITGTNQYLTLTVTNALGFEIFYPYAAPYPRNLELQCVIDSTAVITNNTGTNPAAIQLPLLYTNFPAFTTRFAIASNVLSGKVVAFTNLVHTILMPSALYTNPTANPNLGLIPVTNNPGVDVFHNPLQPGTAPLTIPNLGIYISNSVRYIMVDRELGKVIDFVTMTNLVGAIDLMSALAVPATTGYLPGGGANPPLLVPQGFWDPTPTPSGASVGVTNQIWVGLNSPTPGFWTSYADPNTKKYEVNNFRSFFGKSPVAGGGTVTKTNSISQQAPYNPSIKLYQASTWSVNDPLVHYMAGDLTRTNQKTKFISPTIAIDMVNSTNLDLMTLGRTNHVSIYVPWGGIQYGAALPSMASLTAQFVEDNLNVGMQDPGVRKPDDWDFYTDENPSTPTDQYFPVNRLANVGWLGRVHRGTPWQTIYMKSFVEPPDKWYRKRGSYATHPTNDWRLFDLFTAGVNDNADRGRLSVNQTNRAAWSAILSGVPILTNDLPINNVSKPSTYNNTFIAPNSTQLVAIVNAINRTRTNYVGGVFTNMGQILATPELSTNSPYLDKSGYKIYAGVTDQMIERIPQQIMSLLTLEEHPRVTIYSFGQALKPAAGRPFVLAPGPFFMLCTNYQVTGEAITRTVLHVENLPSMVGGEELAPPRVVVESFNIVPGYDY